MASLLHSSSAPVRDAREGPRGHRAVALRLRAWLHAPELDRQLAEGVQPERSALLSARARHLTSPRARLRMAEDIAEVIESTRRWSLRLTATAPVRCDAVRHAEPELVDLAAALRGAGPASPRAAALAAFLLFDRASPLYDPAARTTVQDVARRAAEALRRPSSSW